MPTIEFLANEYGASKRAELPDGGELLDVCDDVFAPVPFSCRSASCATCQVEIVEGMELLEAPNHQERYLLEILSGPPNLRLACQARVRAGAGVVRIKPVGT
jgi:2Fe-2S ferredoxin